MESSIYGKYFWGGEEVIIANVPVAVVKGHSKKKGEKQVLQNTTFIVCESIFSCS